MPLNETPFSSNSIYERYDFIDVIGQGGMGTVFKAKDLLLDRVVAIKTISSQKVSDDQCELLKQEAAIQAKLNHPNITMLHDFIVDDTAVGLVLEFIEGHSLNQLIALRQLSYRQKLVLINDIILGITHAHNHNIIHCDLKPDNILINFQGVAKVSDFGIARLVKEDKQQAGNSLSMATRLYSSPEQLAGKQPDAQSDIYCLGILAHLILSGEHPLGDLTSPKLISHNIAGKAAVRIDPSVTDNLRKPLLSLLQKKTSARAKSLTEFQAIISREITNSEQDDYDLTQPVIRHQKENTVTKKFKAITLLSTFVIALTITAYVFLFSNKSLINEPIKKYVAISPVPIDETTINAEQWRFNNAINRTLNEFVRSNEQLRLAANEFTTDANNITELAAITGADFILNTYSNCVKQRCEITLQRFNTQTKEVDRETQFQALTLSLDTVRQDTLLSVYSLWDDKPSENLITSIEPTDFNAYLTLYESTQGGTQSSDKDLQTIKEMIKKSPKFIPLYQLHFLSAQHIWEQTGNKAYLRASNELIDQAPTELTKSSELEFLQIKALISQGLFDSAERRLDTFHSIAHDKIQLNDLKSYLAYEKGDYQLALSLDKHNSQLQPSVWRWYNFAVSQYSNGELDQALKSVEQALEMLPEHQYALDLKAVLAMISGDLESSFEIYSGMDFQTMDVDALSNLAYLELLRGDINKSIETISIAIERNDSVAAYFLNRADAYKLNEMPMLATNDYKTAVNLTLNNDDSDALSIKTQALAHLGEVEESLRHAEDAKRRYPEDRNVVYASAIAQTIAGNNQMALIEIQRLVELGESPVWLDTPWFKPLCNEPRFIKIITPSKVCSML